MHTYTHTHTHPQYRYNIIHISLYSKSYASFVQLLQPVRHRLLAALLALAPLALVLAEARPACTLSVALITVACMTTPAAAPAVFLFHFAEGDSKADKGSVFFASAPCPPRAVPVSREGTPTRVAAQCRAAIMLLISTS